MTTNQDEYKYTPPPSISPRTASLPRRRLPCFPHILNDPSATQQWRMIPTTTTTPSHSHQSRAPLRPRPTNGPSPTRGARLTINDSMHPQCAAPSLSALKTTSTSRVACTISTRTTTVSRYRPLTSVLSNSLNAVQTLSSRQSLPQSQLQAGLHGHPSVQTRPRHRLCHRRIRSAPTPRLEPSSVLYRRFPQQPPLLLDQRLYRRSRSC